MFCALTLSAFGSVQASAALWLSALLALAAGYALLPRAESGDAPPAIAWAVVFWTTWVIVTNKWASPSYTAVAPYHAAFLCAGYFVGRRAGIKNVRLCFLIGAVFTTAVALWALWQAAHGIGRVHAIFETPATLAAVINLMLLPGLVLVFRGARQPLLLVAMVIWTSALFAGTSRGGWLALGAGGLIALQLARRATWSFERNRWLLIAAIIGAGWLLARVLPLASTWFVGGASTQTEIASSGFSMADSGSSLARLELYDLAWRSITPASLLAGVGYVGFHYIFEGRVSEITGYDQSTTYFVHNDYLQTLLELGVPALGALLILAVWPQFAAWRAIRRLEADSMQGLTLVAVAAALASMAIHALMDFPFYVPTCLLLYGCALGILDSLASPAIKRPAESSSLRRALIAAALTIGTWILVIPAAAEGAAWHAQRQWRSGHDQNAAYWFEIARRLDPRDWRYHWYVGQFWYAQALQSRKPEVARFADSALADAVNANRREVRALRGRIQLHIEARSLLDAPADAATLVAWADHAVELAPNDAAVAAERALVVRAFGRTGTKP